MSTPGRRLSWIIPARAGFTSRLRLRAGPRRDHPRSRGVYVDAAGDHIALTGSSPLARGLRPVRRRRQCGLGIIPARAGFTACRTGWTGPPPDHPRSRGVYHRCSWGDCRWRRDHPRSRGVYCLAAGSGSPWRGSSPLARGLPLLFDRSNHMRRIIPARAGFTGSPPSSRGPGPDHPRSRGVYRR